MSRTPPYPKNLRPEAKRLWRQVHEDFELDPPGRELLRVGIMSLSNYLEARDKLAEEGMTFKTKSGQVKKHPLIEVMKFERAGFLSSMSQLGLDYNDETPKRGPGRPTVLGV